MVINKKTNRQIILQKTKHRKLNTKQHEPHQKLGVISGAPKGSAGPDLHMASVVLLTLLTISVNSLVR